MVFRMLGLFRLVLLSLAASALLSGRAAATVYEFYFTPGEVIDYGIDDICGDDCVVTGVTGSPPPRRIVLQFNAALLPRLTLREMTLSLTDLTRQLPPYLRIFVEGNAEVLSASLTFDHRSRLIDFFLYGANIDGEWGYAPDHSFRSGEACVLYLESGYEDCNQTYISSGPTRVSYPALIPLPSSLSVFSLGITGLFLVAKRGKKRKSLVQ
jgi:hypothetical protein